MGKFTVKSICDLDELTLGQELDESDYAVVSNGGKFLQFSYKDTDKFAGKIKMSPGTWTVAKISGSLQLVPTKLTNDNILDTFVHTAEIQSRADCFFNRLHVYRDLGFEVPKRAMLLYGPAGSGKTSAINKVCNQYTSMGDTAVLVWHTAAFEPHTIKSLIRNIVYEDSVKRLILVIEDLGGVEHAEARISSDSSLLSLLDNKEKTFTLPTFIMATTNFPHMFMENITNRPERFDDKVELPAPTPQQRLEIFKFFADKRLVVDEPIEKLMLSDKTKHFTPAHIKDTVVRHLIYDKPMTTVITEMAAEIDHAKNSFEKKKESLNIRSWDE